MELKLEIPNESSCSQGSDIQVQYPPSGEDLRSKQNAGKVRIRVARTVQEVEAIRDIWITWRWNPNADIDFYLQILRLRPEILRPHVLVLYRDGSPVAMLVGRVVLGHVEARLGYARLFRTRARTLAFIYGGQAGDLSAENAGILISEIIRSLREGEADLAEFRFVKTDSHFYPLLTQSPGFFMRDRFPEVQPHWSMKLPDSPEAVPNCTSAHERRQIRRRIKLLETDYPGNVRIERFGVSGDLDRMFLDIEEVARKTYHRGLGVGFIDTPEVRRRFQFEAERGWLRAYILYVADKPCAFWMGSLYGAVFYSDKVGYDPVYKKYELGKQLLMKVLEDLCRQSAKQVDFGLGDADWKQRFGDQKWQEASTRIFAPTLKGLGINVLRTLSMFVNQVVKKTLEKTQILARMKRLWRDRAIKGVQHGSTAD